VAAVRGVAAELGISIPIFGMVKDEFHKTRALCTDVEEISIALDQGIYHLIYRIQEEVHRFSVKRMSEAKSKTLKTSSLEKIPGVGKQKAKLLLAHFGGLSAVARADERELTGAPGIGPALAREIYRYFHEKNGGLV